MKNLWKKFIAWLISESEKKVKVDPDVKPDKPTSADVTCGCDLSKTYQEPPYLPSILKAGGNKYECPTIAGRDVRLACKRPNTTPWLLGNLLPNACTFDGKNMSCKCFDADGGRYHFVGYSRKFDGIDFYPYLAGHLFQYKTTTFVWYEWRPK